MNAPDRDLAGTAWMQTYTGRAYWPLNPRAEDVCIEDIAHSLAMQCRYNGHTLGFYSVAQHSVLVSQHCSPENQLWGLLHDAPETYVTDMIRPIKRHVVGYGEIEALTEKAIAEHFGLPLPIPDEVKLIDERILNDERDCLMAKPPRPWNLRCEPIGIRIYSWPPEMAKARFLERFYWLTNDEGVEP